ncbi:hypothetical protein MKZ38_004986 [Zalerion maritima]|uniref:F-box domain-containing protein n=1 Tax=Zalerion maritima TaxID=339359 RepID=A0AAD5RKT2_9PEZI|nr:hypothetical protein MKZ38_004986 [Zalerion maritima]
MKHSESGLQSRCVWLNFKIPDNILEAPARQPAVATGNNSNLLKLPNELLFQVFDGLEADGMVCLAMTNRRLLSIAETVRESKGRGHVCVAHEKRLYFSDQVDPSNWKKVLQSLPGYSASVSEADELSTVYIYSEGHCDKNGPAALGMVNRIGPPHGHGNNWFRRRNLVTYSKKYHLCIMCSTWRTTHKPTWMSRFTKAQLVGRACFPKWPVMKRSGRFTYCGGRGADNDRPYGCFIKSYRTMPKWRPTPLFERINAFCDHIDYRTGWLDPLLVCPDCYSKKGIFRRARDPSEAEKPAGEP